MRAERLLSLMWMLRPGLTVSASVLAERLEVSVRTVYRDVEALAGAGIPVYCERGRSGGVGILPERRSSPPELEDLEVTALLSSITSNTAVLRPELASAVGKLSEGLRRAAPEAVIRAARVVHDPEGWLRVPESPWLERLREAVFEDRIVTFRYLGRRETRGKSSAERTGGDRAVEAYGLVNSAGRWYLAARRSGALRFYRLDRLAELRVTEQGFERRAGFDLQHEWELARSRFRRSLPHMDVTVLVARHALPGLEEEAKSLVVLKEAAGNLRLEPAQGEAETEYRGSWGEWVRVKVGFAGKKHAVAILARFPGQVRVLEPESLSREIVATARAVLDAHGIDSDFGSRG